MPKREPTPPPADDEPKYFTVYYPYPLHTNMAVPEERRALARWVGCCINPKAFTAMYYKPSARNMVILEVSRRSQGLERILGAHKWAEILRNPSAEEVKIESRVFYCTHTCDREAQKHGWKRIDVQDEWFIGFSPNNKFIKFPYPATHPCDLPAEDQTRYRLCRPLPRTVFPPPKPVTKPPPVGSAVWAKNKDAGINLAVPPTSPKPNGNNRSPVTRANSSNTGIPITPSHGHSQKPGVWTNGMITQSAQGKASPSKRGKSKSKSVELSRSLSRSASAANPSQMSTRPPGLTLPVSASSSQSGDWWTADGADDGPADEPLASMIDSTHETNIAVVDVTQSLWADVPAKPSVPSPPICNAHGVVCRKGICAEYSKQLKKLQQAAEKKKNQEEAHVDGSGRRGTARDGRKDKDGDARGDGAPDGRGDDRRGRRNAWATRDGSGPGGWNASHKVSVKGWSDAVSTNGDVGATGGAEVGPGWGVQSADPDDWTLDNGHDAAGWSGSTETSVDASASKNWQWGSGDSTDTISGKNNDGADVQEDDDDDAWGAVGGQVVTGWGATGDVVTGWGITPVDGERDGWGSQEPVEDGETSIEGWGVTPADGERDGW